MSKVKTESHWKKVKVEHNELTASIKSKLYEINILAPTRYSQCRVPRFTQDLQRGRSPDFNWVGGCTLLMKMVPKA